MNVSNYMTTDVITIGPGDSVDKSIVLMEEHDIHHLVVTVGSSVVGVVSDRDILISTGWMLSVERRVHVGGPEGPAQIVGPTRVEQIMSQPAVCISADESACDAARLMVHQRIGVLPVVQQGRLAGVVSETDLVRWMLRVAVAESGVERFLGQQVRALARSNLITVRPSAPLGELVDLFRRRQIRHVPVVVNGQLVGIISDRDVRRALGWSSVRDMQAEEHGRLDRSDAPRVAADIMHNQVITTNSFAPLSEAARVMLERRIHSLPVVDGELLSGILTQTDLVKAIVREELL